MAMAIFRTKKLKTAGEIAGSTKHCMRSIPTPNAVPGVKNRILYGSANPRIDIERMADAAQGRSNSVRCIEILATASSDWFDTATKDQINDWTRSTCVELAKIFGKENIAHLQLHLDESTPHITGYIVPVKDGKLNARHWLGGRKNLSELQDRMAACVAHLGIERGIKGSKAKHQRVKRFYGALEAETPAWRQPSTWERLTSDAWLKDIQDDHETMQLQAAAGKAAQYEIAGARATANAAMGDAQRKADEAAAAKEQLNAIRATPLLHIVQALGLEQDKDKNWKDAERSFAITLKDQKFYDHKAGQGGGGAIDLVKHVMQCDFTTAKQWLMQRIGADEYIGNAVDEARRKAEAEVKATPKAVLDGTKPVFKAPEPADDNWHYVERYLTQARKLSSKLVAGLYKRGAVYADRFRNAVFTAPVWPSSEALAQSLLRAWHQDLTRATPGAALSDPRRPNMSASSSRKAPSTPCPTCNSTT